MDYLPRKRAHLYCSNRSTWLSSKWYAQIILSLLINSFTCSIVSYPGNSNQMPIKQPAQPQGHKKPFISPVPQGSYHNPIVGKPKEVFSPSSDQIAEYPDNHEEGKDENIDDYYDDDYDDQYSDEYSIAEDVDQDHHKDHEVDGVVETLVSSTLPANLFTEVSTVKISTDKHPGYINDVYYTYDEVDDDLYNNKKLNNRHLSTVQDTSPSTVPKSNI